MQASLPTAQNKFRLARTLRVTLALSLLLVLGSMGFAFEYHRYSRVVDRRLAHSALFTARPCVVPLMMSPMVFHLRPRNPSPWALDPAP